MQKKIIKIIMFIFFMLHKWSAINFLVNIVFNWISLKYDIDNISDAGYFESLWIFNWQIQRLSIATGA